MTEAIAVSPCRVRSEPTNWLRGPIGLPNPKGRKRRPVLARKQFVASFAPLPVQFVRVRIRIAPNPWLQPKVVSSPDYGRKFVPLTRRNSEQRPDRPSSGGKSESLPTRAIDLSDADIRKAEPVEVADVRLDRWVERPNCFFHFPLCPAKNEIRDLGVLHSAAVTPLVTGHPIYLILRGEAGIHGGAHYEGIASLDDYHRSPRNAVHLRDCRVRTAAMVKTRMHGHHIEALVLVRKIFSVSEGPGVRRFQALFFSLVDVADDDVPNPDCVKHFRIERSTRDYEYTVVQADVGTDRRFTQDSKIEAFICHPQTLIQ